MTLLNFFANSISFGSREVRGVIGANRGAATRGSQQHQEKKETHGMASGWLGLLT
jgi:hypothetical protein